MSAPYFSICIPVFNGASFVREAVDSVSRQTFADWELIVIDNHSTDETWEILQTNYSAHPQIRLIRNSENIGLTGNLNRALELSTGTWLGILPADDAYAAHALETIYRATVRREDLVLWMHAHFVHGEGIIPNVCPVYSCRIHFDTNELAEMLYLKGNRFGELSSYLVRRKYCDGHSFTGAGQNLDTKFWIKVLWSAPYGIAVYWPDMLVHVRQHGGSETNSNLRAGKVYADLFSTAAELSSLGWRRGILMLQLFRVLRCWIKFSKRLPADSRHIPRRAFALIWRHLLFLAPRSSATTGPQP